jgi:hypothetical protein
MDSVQKRDRNRKSREKKENKAARKQERSDERKQRKESGFTGPSAVPSSAGEGEVARPRGYPDPQSPRTSDSAP